MIKGYFDDHFCHFPHSFAILRTAEHPLFDHQVARNFAIITVLTHKMRIRGVPRVRSSPQENCNISRRVFYNCYFIFSKSRSLLAPSPLRSAPSGKTTAFGFQMLSVCKPQLSVTQGETKRSHLSVRIRSQSMIFNDTSVAREADKTCSNPSSTHPLQEM